MYIFVYVFQEIIGSYPFTHFDVHRHEEVCNVPASQLYPSPNEVEEDL